MPDSSRRQVFCGFIHISGSKSRVPGLAVRILCPLGGHRASSLPIVNQLLCFLPPHLNFEISSVLLFPGFQFVPQKDQSKGCAKPCLTNVLEERTCSNKREDKCD